MTVPTTTNPADSNANGSAEGGQKPDTVTREAFDRLLSEKKEEQKKRQAQDAELAAYKEKERLAAEDEAKKRGDFESILAAEKEHAAKLKDEIAKRDALIETVKVEKLVESKARAFFKALGSGLDEKFHSLVDLDNVKVDSEGNIDQASATKYANDFRTEYGTILTKPGPNNFPDGKPQGGGVTGNWLAGKTTKDNLKERKAGLRDAVEKRSRELGILK